MNRRKYLATVGGTLTALSGCLDKSRRQPSAVSVESENVTPPDPATTLQIAYSGETKWELETNPPTRAEEGYKWLVVELSITNVGGELHEVSPSRYVVLVDNEMYEFVASDVVSSLRGKELPPGGGVIGKIPFHIPNEATAATLTVQKRVQPAVTVIFTRAA